MCDPIPAQHRGVCSSQLALSLGTQWFTLGWTSPQHHAPAVLSEDGRALCSTVAKLAITRERKYTEAACSRRAALKSSFTAEPRAVPGGRGSRSLSRGSAVGLVAAS